MAHAVFASDSLDFTGLQSGEASSESMGSPNSLIELVRQRHHFDVWGETACPCMRPFSQFQSPIDDQSCSIIEPT